MQTQAELAVHQYPVKPGTVLSCLLLLWISLVSPVQAMSLIFIQPDVANVEVAERALQANMHHGDHGMAEAQASTGYHGLTASKDAGTVQHCQGPCCDGGTDCGAQSSHCTACSFSSLSDPRSSFPVANRASVHEVHPVDAAAFQSLRRPPPYRPPIP